MFNFNSYNLPPLPKLVKMSLIGTLGVYLNAVLSPRLSLKRKTASTVPQEFVYRARSWVWRYIWRDVTSTPSTLEFCGRPVGLYPADRPMGLKPVLRPVGVNPAERAVAGRRRKRPDVTRAP